jgi:hypothetical protein
MQMSGIAWRYGVISRGVQIPRAKDCFSSGNYAAFRIEDAYVPGRVLEVIGDHLPILKVCMFQGKGHCSYSNHTRDGNCNPTCRKWLFTTANHTGVLCMDDIFSIFEGRNQLQLSADSYRSILDPQEAEKLFYFIDRLEARQKIAQA